MPTIGDLTLATSLLDDDLIEVELAASGLSRKVTLGTLLGGAVISVYDEGDWSTDMTLTGSTGAPTISYTTRQARYWRINNRVSYRIKMVIDTISGGTGTARLSLPHTVGYDEDGVVRLSGVDIGATAVHLTFGISPATAYGVFVETIDNAAIGVLSITQFAAGDTIVASGQYEI
jgi:hypothetical protein